MKKAHMKPSWALAGVAAMALLLFAGCTTDSKNYPTQPSARNVEPGIETGPLQAAFTCSNDFADPFTIVCQDNSTGPIESWFWEFGDGRTSSARNPRHTYKAEGSYVVVLTVSNANSSSTASAIVDVGESEPEPAS